MAQTLETVKELKAKVEQQKADLKQPASEMKEHLE